MEQYEDDDYERYWYLYSDAVIGDAEPDRVEEPYELLEDDEVTAAEAGFWSGALGTT